MADEQSVLRVACEERDRTEQALREHIRSCNAPRVEAGSASGYCPTCTSLSRHFDRCMEQVELLIAEEPGSEALF